MVKMESKRRIVQDFVPILAKCTDHFNCGERQNFCRENLEKILDFSKSLRYNCESRCGCFSVFPAFSQAMKRGKLFYDDDTDR